VHSCFISGIDTNIGKTLITGLIARYCYLKNISFTTQKWVQTGSKKPDDILTHESIINRSIQLTISKERCPYIFSLPASPHLAAEQEKITIQEKVIATAFNKLQSEFKTVLVEGAGGLLVPFQKQKCMSSIVKNLNLPVVLVTSNRLGSINHTRLTIEACNNRNLKVLGCIISTTDPKTHPKIIEDMQKSLYDFFPNLPTTTLPYSQHSNQLLSALTPFLDQF